MPSQVRPVDRRRARRPQDKDRVPVLPRGVPFLIRAMNDDSLSFADIARAIEHVPSVAARLLALANSAWSAPLQPITSLEAACSRLGMRVVRTTSLALAISQPFNPARCPTFNGAIFWSSALLNAEAAAWVEQHAWRKDTGTARTAGLLSNLGLVWLAESLPTQTAKALALARDAASGQLNGHLHDICGLGYDEAGALLAEAWHLPVTLRDAIAQQFDDSVEAAPLGRMVRGATRIASFVRREREWTEPDPDLVQLGLDLPAQLAGMRYMNAIRLKTIELAETVFLDH